MTPEETVRLDRFDIDSTKWSDGFPGLLHRKEWYAIEFKGQIRLPKCDGDCVLRLTSDDGSKLFIDDELVIDNDGLHSPHAEESPVFTNSAGLFNYKLQWFQGPRQLISLKLELSTDNGYTFKIVKKRHLRYAYQ
jgi:hypothetical protein